MAATVNVNGTITDEQHAVISVFDHGFLYGAGVYETLRTYRQRPFLLDRHLRRLRASAGMINLPVPLSNDAMETRIGETIAHASQDARVFTPEWYVRILLTRGVGELSYDPAATLSPSLVMIVKPHVEPAPELYERGVAVVFSSVVRNHPDALSPMIKSNNLLNNEMAMQEGLRRGAYEVVMRNHRGELAEAALSNIFIVKGGAALTPPLSAGLLPGITREYLFEVGRAADVAIREAVLRDEDLYDADEAFLTGTTREIMPVTTVDGRRIGTGTPGPVTRVLHRKFRALVADGDPRIGV